MREGSSRGRRPLWLRGPPVTRLRRNDLAHGGHVDRRRLLYFSVADSILILSSEFEGAALGANCVDTARVQMED